MSANVLLANRSSLSNPASPPSPYSHSEWQHYSPPETWVRPDLPLSHPMSPHPFSHHQASGSGSSTQMHNGFSQNQASIRTLFAPVPLADVRACNAKTLGSSTSSLSSALDEDLSRPWGTKDRLSPPFSGRIASPSPGSVRISQSCKVSPSHEVVHFRYQSQHGIPVDALLAGTRQIDYCDSLLNSPAGSASLMHIAVSNLPVTSSPHTPDTAISGTDTLQLGIVSL